MRDRFCAGAFVALAAAMIGHTAFAQGILLSCETLSVEVRAETLKEAERVCDIAALADAGLSEFGLETGQGILIEVSEDLPGAPGHCLALYDIDRAAIQLLPLRCLEENPVRFGPFPHLAPEVYFESLLVHEMTHAYLEQAAGDRFVPRIAHEYLAYAIQLDRLSANDRARLMQAAGIDGPVAIDDLNEAVLNLLPLRFAALSWLHFRDIGANAEAVRRVLTGDIAFRSLLE